MGIFFTRNNAVQRIGVDFRTKLNQKFNGFKIVARSRTA